MDEYWIKATAELEEVRAQKAKLELREKQLEAFLALYEPASAPSMPPLMLGLSLRIAPTAKARVTTAVAGILADGIARSTRTLLTELSKLGIEIGSQDKVIGLSNLLSKDDRFVADRANGWSLKKEGP